MNKKLLGLGLAVTFLAMLVGPALAGKGQTKQYYEFWLEGISAPGPDTKMWTTEDGVLQARDFGFIASYIEVTVGGVTYYPDPASYSATIDFTLDTVALTLDIRVHETFIVDGIGTITQKTAETIYDYGTPDMAGGGNFVGFGSEGLEGVKILGTTGMVDGHPVRVGTLMGWPTA